MDPTGFYLHLNLILLFRNVVLPLMPRSFTDIYIG